MCVGECVCVCVCVCKTNYIISLIKESSNGANRIKIVNTGKCGVYVCVCVCVCVCVVMLH